MKRHRVFGKHVLLADGCEQHVLSDAGEGIVPAGYNNELIKVFRYSATLDMALSPFGKLVYERKDAAHIADALIRLAGQIRRETQ